MTTIQEMVPSDRDAARKHLQAFVERSLVHAASMLGKGVKPAAVFLVPGKPEDAVVISASPVEDVRDALLCVSPLEAPGAIASPSMADALTAILHLVSQVRRSLPFITGPGADMAKKILLDAIAAEGHSEKARQVVAGYLASVPGMHTVTEADIDKMLAAAEAGQGQVLLDFFTHAEVGELEPGARYPKAATDVPGAEAF